MANRPSLLDLGELARSEIERSISAPNLLTAQPWGEQIDFHKSNAIGRYLSGGNQGGKKWRGFQGTLLTTNPSQKIATADKGPMLARA